MLDILEKFLIRKGYSSSRLDGSTPMNCRQSLVDEFNSSPSKQVVYFENLSNIYQFSVIEFILFSGFWDLLLNASIAIIGIPYLN